MNETDKSYTASVPQTFKFHIGDLITVTSGRMVSPRGKMGLYGIVDYMSGRKHLTGLLWGNEFIRDAEACKAVLLQRYPWLAEITVPDSVNDDATGQVFLDMVAARYGSHHEVTQSSAATQEWGHGTNA